MRKTFEVQPANWNNPDLSLTVAYLQAERRAVTREVLANVAASRALNALRLAKQQIIQKAAQ